VVKLVKGSELIGLGFGIIEVCFHVYQCFRVRDVNSDVNELLFIWEELFLRCLIQLLKDPNFLIY
jgi:hypothetical protein